MREMPGTHCSGVQRDTVVLQGSHWSPCQAPHTTECFRLPALLLFLHHEEITERIVHLESFSALWNHTFPEATQIPSRHPALDSWSQCSHSTEVRWPQLTRSPTPTQLDPHNLQYLSRQQKKPIIFSLKQEGPHALTGVCSAHFPSARQPLTFQLLHGRGSNAQWQEGTQQRGRRIFIKITSCEACDGSVNMQRDIQKACTRSSGNVNQHSPVSFNRVPHLWAAASSPLPWIA